MVGVRMPAAVKGMPMPKGATPKVRVMRCASTAVGCRRSPPPRGSSLPRRVGVGVNLRFGVDRSPPGCTGTGGRSTLPGTLRSAGRAHRLPRPPQASCRGAAPPLVGAAPQRDRAHLLRGEVRQQQRRELGFPEPGRRTMGATTTSADLHAGVAPTMKTNGVVPWPGTNSSPASMLRWLRTGRKRCAGSTSVTWTQNGPGRRRHPRHTVPDAALRRQGHVRLLERVPGQPDTETGPGELGQDSPGHCRWVAQVERGSAPARRRGEYRRGADLALGVGRVRPCGGSPPAGGRVLRSPPGRPACPWPPVKCASTSATSVPSTGGIPSFGMTDSVTSRTAPGGSEEATGASARRQKGAGLCDRKGHGHREVQRVAHGNASTAGPGWPGSRSSAVSRLRWLC